MSNDTIERDGGELVLTFELEPGSNADALVAAESLIAWVGLIRETHSAMEPSGDVRVELISADVACLRLRTLLHFIEDKAMGVPADALAEYPRIKKLVVATVLGVPAGVVAAAIGSAILPDATVKLSKAGQEVYASELKRVQAVPEVRKRAQTFYKTVSRDKNVTEVSVGEGVGMAPVVSIDRSEFAERSGMWESQEQAPHERPRRDTWNVVVTHPVMKASAVSWRFERDGLPFSAKMADETFLAAIADGSLPITIQEGVQMQVVVEWTEQLQGQSWEPMNRSRKITRVLSPRPTAAPPRTMPIFRND